jgi:hypothetical protein
MIKKKKKTAVEKNALFFFGSGRRTMSTVVGVLVVTFMVAPAFRASMLAGLMPLLGLGCIFFIFWLILVRPWLTRK